MQHEMPRGLPGFERINRYWDRQRDMPSAKILPGEYYVTVNDELISTVLGSCVSACIRDTLFGIGGMNHFMLPVNRDELKADRVIGDAERYGNYAMEHMINDILSHGGRRSNLEVKVFGGGRIIRNMTNVGARNIDFVLEYIHSEGLNLLAQDVGGDWPRKVVYQPMTGKVFVKRLRNLHNDTIIQREEHYRHEIEEQPVAGEIELFD